MQNQPDNTDIDFSEGELIKPSIKRQLSLNDLFDDYKDSENIEDEAGDQMNFPFIDEFAVEKTPSPDETMNSEIPSLNENEYPTCESLQDAILTWVHLHSPQLWLSMRKYWSTIVGCMEKLEKKNVITTHDFWRGAMRMLLVGDKTFIGNLKKLVELLENDVVSQLETWISHVAYISKYDSPIALDESAWIDTSNEEFDYELNKMYWPSLIEDILGDQMVAVTREYDERIGLAIWNGSRWVLSTDDKNSICYILRQIVAIHSRSLCGVDCTSDARLDIIFKSLLSSVQRTVEESAFNRNIFCVAFVKGFRNTDSCQNYSFMILNHEETQPRPFTINGILGDFKSLVVPTPYSIAASDKSHELNMMIEQLADGDQNKVDYILMVLSSALSTVKFGYYFRFVVEDDSLMKWVQNALSVALGNKEVSEFADHLVKPLGSSGYESLLYALRSNILFAWDSSDVTNGNAIQFISNVGECVGNGYSYENNGMLVCHGKSIKSKIMHGDIDIQLREVVVASRLKLFFAPRSNSYGQKVVSKALVSKLVSSYINLVNTRDSITSLMPHSVAEDSFGTHMKWLQPVTSLNGFGFYNGIIHLIKKKLLGKEAVKELSTYTKNSYMFEDIFEQIQ